MVLLKEATLKQIMEQLKEKFGTYVFAGMMSHCEEKGQKEAVIIHGEQIIQKGLIDLAESIVDFKKMGRIDDMINGRNYE